MKKPLVNFGHSVRARLLAVAKERGLQFEYVLLRYALERFLYRLGISNFANCFVLKGASAFAAWLGPFCRATRDADLEAFGDMSPDRLKKAFAEICAISCPDDGVEFDLTSFTTTEIKREDKYPGVRLFFRAMIGGACVPLQFDIGCGDNIYPEAEKLTYPTLLGAHAPCICVYPRYTVVAEKFQVIVVRGVLNSRLKDYYDIWLLAGSFDFDYEVLQTAIKSTFGRRDTEVPREMPPALTEAFSKSADKLAQWRGFLRASKLEEIALTDVVERLAAFFDPVITCGPRVTSWCCLSGKWL